MRLTGARKKEEEQKRYAAMDLFVRCARSFFVVVSFSNMKTLNFYYISYFLDHHIWLRRKIFRCIAVFVCLAIIILRQFSVYYTSSRSFIPLTQLSVFAWVFSFSPKWFIAINIIHHMVGVFFIRRFLLGCLRFFFMPFCHPISNG